MRAGLGITRRAFVAAIPTAVVAGLLGPKALANAQQVEEEIGLGRVLFDHSFEWDEHGAMVHFGTQEEYDTLLSVEVGELLRLEPFDEGRPFRSESVYPCCKLASETGASWHGLLYDKFDMDLDGLRALEASYPIFARMESQSVMDVDCRSGRGQLVTLTLNLFALLDD
ncbi:hypothetical protein [Enorma phocaeensis]|uniref:hypothetical protein n=1 Tax=Enorma phocaeensis TaxID=1871019 RepID=UPI003207AFEC